MIEVSPEEGFAIAGTAGLLLFILYRSLGRRRVPSGLTLFDQSSDDAWFPSRLPVEPAGDVYYTDEERVLRLLIVHEGRMQQSEIVRKTGWSSAKVSRLLQRMENRNDVSRISAGRTKVVYLGHYQTGGE